MKKIPRISLAQLPTPVEPLKNLSAKFDGSQLWIKRDDQTGLAFGGNKTRKLEMLMAEALANGARTVITAGAVQSNHCRQTAAAAAKLGLDCILVLTGQAPDLLSGNTLLDHLLGAELVYARKEERESTLTMMFQKAWEEGKRPYLIPYGGSNPTGAAAYAYAFAEFVQQGIEIDWVVTASSSGGTQAGMVLGAKVSGFRGKVLGISVDEPAAVLEERVLTLANQTADLLDAGCKILKEDIYLNAEYLGKGYGIPTDYDKRGIIEFAREEGILLDPVYTGRAAGAVLDLLEKGLFKHGERILFWHTGGAPALFADAYRELFAGS